MSSDHFVCFDCRKQFQIDVYDARQTVLLKHPSKKGFRIMPRKLTHPCPQCGKEMVLLGKRFRAPKQSDAEGWEVARRLSNAGFGYWGHYGKMPTRLKDVQSFIDKNRRKNKGEQLLEKWGVNL